MTKANTNIRPQYTSVNMVEVNAQEQNGEYKYIFQDDKYCGPLSTVNILIGRNNSGKSKFLRTLLLNQFTYSEVNYVDRHIVLEHLDALLAILNDTATQMGVNTKQYSIGGYRQEKGQQVPFKHPLTFIEDLRKKIDEQFEPSLFNKDFAEITRNLIEAKDYNLPTNMNNTRIRDQIGSGNFKEFVEQVRNSASMLNTIIEDTSEHITTELVEKKFYIPMIRGMRPLLVSSDKETDDVNHYFDRTKKDYFHHMEIDKEKIEIFTGLELYQKLQRLLLGRPEWRDWVKEYEEVISKYFFDKEPISLIPEMDYDTVSIKIGDEDQFPIFHLGDGLQTIIIMTFNAYIEQKRCLFFMEEPDLCLHPGQQRTLIRFLLKECPKHQYFLTTHSNHLLELSLDFDDISIFSMNKQFNPDEQSSEKPSTIFEISNLSSKDFNILSELGVRNSSVLLSNSTIWVEGITDRYYLRSYMKKFVNDYQGKNEDLSKLKEDYHYSFVEYQGSTLDHWTWDQKDEGVKRIQAKNVCANSVLIADGDIETKGGRKKEYQQMFGKDQFIGLESKEIENLIPAEILKKYLLNDGGINPRSIKIDSIVRSEYQGKDKDKKFIGLGAYLNERLNLKKYCDSKSGTIKNKKLFCEKVTKLMDEKDDWKLPSDMEDICRKIFTHILKQNGYNTVL